MSPRVIAASGNQSSLTPYDWGNAEVDKPSIIVSPAPAILDALARVIAPRDVPTG